MDLLLIAIAILLYMIPVLLASLFTISVKADISKSSAEPNGKQLLKYVFFGSLLTVIIINLFSFYEFYAIGIALLIGIIIGIVAPERS